MPRTRPYTTESPVRALEVHKADGIISGFNPPVEGGHKTWLIEVPGFNVVEFTTPQVYGLTVGLGAARRARMIAEVDADIGNA